MTIGKLPATGPSPSPTQKTRKPPTTTGLASSKPNRPRTACRQSPSSLNPVHPQNHRQRLRVEPALPTRRQPGPVAPPRPSGRSRTPHPPRNRLRDRRKTVRRQAQPRLMRRRPRPSRLRSASRPRRHRNLPTRPPAAPRRPGTGTSKDTSRRQADAVDATASPIHWQARSGAVEADGPLRASNAERKRACPLRASGQQPAQDPGLTQFQKDLAGWSSSKVALLSKEYVSTITAQHIRLLSRKQPSFISMA